MLWTVRSLASKIPGGGEAGCFRGEFEGSLQAVKPFGDDCARHTWPAHPVPAEPLRQWLKGSKWLEPVKFLQTFQVRTQSGSGLRHSVVATCILPSFRSTEQDHRWSYGSRLASEPSFNRKTFNTAY